MSVVSRLSGKNFDQMPPFITELSTGVNEDIERVAAPLRQEINALRQEINVLRQQLNATAGVAQNALGLAQQALG
jgi:HAMP domain-containing protein